MDLPDDDGTGGLRRLPTALAAVHLTGYRLSIDLYFQTTMKRVAETLSLCSRAVVGLTGRYSSTETDRAPADDETEG